MTTVPEVAPWRQFDFLDGDLFRDALFAYQEQEKDRRSSRGRAARGTRDFAKTLLSDAETQARTRQWLLLAFDSPKEHCAANEFYDSLHHDPLSEDILQFATEVFCLAYSDSASPRIEALINKERRLRGFMYQAKALVRNGPTKRKAKLVTCIKSEPVDTILAEGSAIPNNSKKPRVAPPARRRKKSRKSTSKRRLPHVKIEVDESLPSDALVSIPQAQDCEVTERLQNDDLPAPQIEDFVPSTEVMEPSPAITSTVAPEKVSSDVILSTTPIQDFVPPIEDIQPFLHDSLLLVAQSPDLRPTEVELPMNIDLLPNAQIQISKPLEPHSPILQLIDEGSSSLIPELIPNTSEDIPAAQVPSESLPLPSHQTPELLVPTPRPVFPGYPPIWAKSRQEVCESFAWFRSFQGGVYHSNGYVKGYLLSAFASSRDIFHHDGRLIISHGGGKWESQHSIKGQTETHLADDQLAQDKSVRSLIANYKQRRPLVLLVDDKYALFPWDLTAGGVTYAILGFFFISHVWAEYQPAANGRGRVVRYKFAFQWYEKQGQPWWIPSPSPIAPQTLRGTATAAITSPMSEVHEPIIPTLSTCCRCRTISPKIYQEWMCSNAECPSFWQVNGKMADENHLSYDATFLKPVKEPPLLLRREDLLPVLPSSHPDSGITTDYAFTRGWHCRKCGRLSCRSKWEKWDCPQCGEERLVQGRVRKASEFLGIKVKSSFQDHHIADGCGIKKGLMVIFPLPRGQGSYRVFDLPHQRGRIIHIRGLLPFGNQEADQLFEQYQQQAATGELPFRRWPLRAHKLRGQMLTHYFSQNAGIPYQYVGGAANTIPLDRLPVVASARDLIMNRLSAVGINATFNEVLSCAYMCKQKMAFHSDAEAGLGPMVAGLSLGAPAIMHFRNRKTEGEPGIVMSLVLRHGDVLVMDGSQVQQFYEHMVIPTNFRIAATARMIYSENAADSSVSRAVKFEDKQNTLHSTLLEPPTPPLY